MESARSAPIEIIHYADPWCWWSWGMEPVLLRLKEVYGEQMHVTYRMGGITDDRTRWMHHYGIENDQGLIEWIQESCR